MTGTNAFSDGEFVATLTNDTNHDPVDIYSITSNGRLQFWDRDKTNPYKLLIYPEPPGIPGQAEYPPLSDLYRIHVHTNNLNTYLIGTKYKHIPAHNNHLSWTSECFYGIRQGCYTSPFGSTNFSSISKNFRKKYCFPTKNSTLTQHEVSHHFANICTTHPDINWNKKLRALAEARSDSKPKNTLWRIISDNLYVGPKAATFLRRKKLNDAADKYDHCPYCQHRVPSSLKHQFWECPHVRPFWNTVSTLFASHNLPSAPRSFDDIYMFIDSANTNDLLLLFRDDLLYNAIFSIWYEYNHIMRHMTRFSDDEYRSRVTHLSDHLIDKFNSLNRRSFLLVPYHVQYLINRRSASSNSRSTSSGLLVRYHLIQSPLSFDLDNLSDNVIDAYSRTWCKRNSLGIIINSIPQFIALKTRFSHPPPR